MFVDYSDPVRLVIVKWDRHSIFLRFLLLCGDNEPNPGPDACSVCGVNVSDDDRAVGCDLCDMSLSYLVTPKIVMTQ